MIIVCLRRMDDYYNSPSTTRCISSFCNPLLVVSTHTHKQTLYQGCLLCVLLVDFFWVFSDFRFPPFSFNSKFSLVLERYPIYSREFRQLKKSKYAPHHITLISLHVLPYISSWFRERLKH